MTLGVQELKNSIFLAVEDGPTLRLDYYITKEIQGMYGVTVRKFVSTGNAFELTEEESLSEITFLHSEIVRICGTLAHYSVTPCTLGDVIQDMDICIGEPEISLAVK